MSRSIYCKAISFSCHHRGQSTELLTICLLRLFDKTPQLWAVSKASITAFLITLTKLKRTDSFFLCFLSLYSICLPRVSMGKKIIATKAAKMSAPETKIGAFGLASGMFAAIMGAQRPPIRFKKLEIPVPVPLLGAGNTSGV
jgi:hypothetical protein